MRRIMRVAALAAALAAGGAWAQFAGTGPGMMGPFGGHPMTRGAQGPFGGAGMGLGMMGAYAYEWLGLTPRQREAIAAIEAQIWQSHWSLMRELGASGGPRSPEEMAALRARMLEAMRDTRRRIEAVLTVEQRARLAELWEGCAPAG